ncbi:hypothetical protein [Yersinia bercovieri]|uniref:hypothetical protein n=1 Tax=Yersinia bercovieri TaxID=634 RepID=UPI0030D3ABF9
MLDWLNTHIGVDWATYQGWGISIISLGFTVFAAPKIIKISMSSIKQWFEDEEQSRRDAYF